MTYIRFDSKKDRWLSVLIWFTIGLLMSTLVISYITEDLSVAAFIILAIILILSCIFLIWCWFATYYVLTDDVLIIRSGPIKQVIEYTAITSLQKTTNPLSGPALSMKRIEIVHGLYQVTIISPENRDQFINTLHNKSPQINI